MSRLVVRPVKSLNGELAVPGDKSISHRAVMFGALAQGTTVIHRPLTGEDVMSTQACFSAMGAKIEFGQKVWQVHGVGANGLKGPAHDLNCGNSGTTMRLMTGILAGQKFNSVLVGDASLSERPMARVIDPLTKMGAIIQARSGGKAPLKIIGNQLTGCEIDIKVASAQVKSAIVLAGLFANGLTTVRGKIQSRDHTERMLPAFGIKLRATDEFIQIEGGQALTATEVKVPGDISSAAFWLAAGAIVPKSRIKISGVSLNPTRTGILNVLKRMGANPSITVESEFPEPIGSVEVEHGALVGTTITEAEVPQLVDEIPVIAIMATQAKGRTEVSGAEELRVKESDRLESVAINLRAMGAEIELKKDGFIIEGPQKLFGANLIQTFDDHRIAMSFAIAGLIARGETTLDNSHCVAISYPDFFAHLEQLSNG